MIRGLLSGAALVSLVAFPWLYTVLLTLVGTAYEPFLPLAIGLLADVLYYTPSGSFFPLFTISGGAVTAITLFVRSRLRSDTIG
jgi:hypothetical protein